jgi:hypothetical protein
VSDPATKIVTVTVSPQDEGAKVSYEGAEAPTFAVDVSRGGTQQITYIVESQDGKQRQPYTLWLEQWLDFEEYVRTRWDNTMIINALLLDKESYRLLACRWYEEGLLVGTGLYFSKGGSLSDVFAPGLKYHFELETEEGLVRSTPRTFEETFPGGFRAYPNPISSGETLYVDANTEERGDNQEAATVSIYSISGALLLQKPLSGSHAQLLLSLPVGLYVVKVKNWQSVLAVR